MRIRLALVCLAILSLGFTASAQQTSPVPPAKHAPQATHVKKKANLRVKATAHSVVLTWVQGVVPTGSTCPSGSGSTAITSNNVYRATTAGGEGTTPYAPVSPAGTTYTDTAVTAGTTYYYQVTAVNCASESAHSTEASATIPNPLVPNAPTSLTLTAQ